LVDHDGFIQALCDQGLAFDNGDEAEMKGFKQRAGWLKHAEESGKEGGRKSGESRRNKREGYPSQNRRELLKGREGSANPLTLTLTHAPDHAHAHAERDATSSPISPAGAGLAEFQRVAAAIGSTPIELATEPSPEKPSRRKPARQLPADWAPGDSHRAIAAERRVDISSEAGNFRDWAISKAETKSDWDAAFRLWLRRAKPSQNQIQLQRGSQAPRKFRDYTEQLDARQRESEKVSVLTGMPGESETGK
jgi:hypothetical protein